MKSASARLRKGKIFVQAFSQTTTKLWIAYGPVYIASSEDDLVEIGGKVLSALANSIFEVQHPSQGEWKFIQAPMLEAVGVKSWATLEKGAKGVGIDDQGDLIVITPSISGAEGSQDVPEKAVHSAKDAKALGEALLKAFAACE